MIWLWACVAILILCTQSNAAITLVNITSGTGGGFASSVATSAFSVTTGNLIVCGERNVDASAGGPPTGVTDTAGNTYTNVTGVVMTDGLSSVSIWRAKNITGNASNVVTAAYTSSHTRTLVCHQYSGLDTSAPDDANATGSGTSGTTLTSGTFSTTTANEVIFVVGTDTVSPGYTPESGYTEQYDDGTTATEDKIVSATQSSITATMTQGASLPWGIAVATFKEAASAAAPVQRRVINY